MKRYIVWNPACYVYPTENLRGILKNLIRNYDRLCDEENEMIIKGNKKAAKIRREKAENFMRLIEDVENELSIRED